MKHRNASAATREHVNSPPPAPQTWKLLATQLRHLDQRVAMSTGVPDAATGDVPDATTGPHLRALIWLEDAASGDIVTLPPRLHHRLRPGPPDRACFELLAPKTERGQAFARGLRLAWSGRRASEMSPLWDAMNVDVRGRGALEAAAGVLSAWARSFPDAIVTITEAADAEHAAGGAPETTHPSA